MIEWKVLLAVLECLRCCTGHGVMQTVRKYPSPDSFSPQTRWHMLVCGIIIDANSYDNIFRSIFEFEIYRNGEDNFRLPRIQSYQSIART